jgi:hypothetical protein
MQLLVWIQLGFLNLLAQGFSNYRPCINYVMGLVYCLLCVGLDISTVVMEPNVLAGY